MLAQLPQAHTHQSAADAKELAAPASASFCTVTLGWEGPGAAGGVTGAALSATACSAGPAAAAAAVELGRMCIVWQESSSLQSSEGKQWGWAVGALRQQLRQAAGQLAQHMHRVNMRQHASSSRRRGQGRRAWMRSAHLKVPCRQLPSSPSSGRRLRLADSIREHLQAHGDRWQMQRRKGIGARALAAVAATVNRVLAGRLCGRHAIAGHGGRQGGVCLVCPPCCLGSPLFLGPRGQPLLLPPHPQHHVLLPCSTAAHTVADVV